MNLHQPTVPQPLRFRNIRDIGEVVTATLEFLRENYKPLGKAMLFIVGPVVLITGIIGAGMQVGMMAALMGSGYYSGGNDESYTDYDTPSSLSAFTGVGAVTLLVVWTMLLIIVTATTAVVYSYIVLYMDRGGVQPTVREVWNEAKTHFARLLGTFIGIGIMYFIASFVVAMIPIIGFIAIMVGGPYVVVALSLVGIIRVREQLSLSDSISRSFDLIRNNWWRTALLLLIIWVVMWAILSNLAMPQLILTALFTMNTVDTDNDPSLWLGILTFIMAFLYMFGSFLLYPLPLVAIAVQYFNLVEQKEGIGLRERVEQFGQSLEISSAHEESM